MRVDRSGDRDVGVPELSRDVGEGRAVSEHERPARVPERVPVRQGFAVGVDQAGAQTQTLEYQYRRVDAHRTARAAREDVAPLVRSEIDCLCAPISIRGGQRGMPGWRRWHPPRLRTLHDPLGLPVGQGEDERGHLGSRARVSFTTFERPACALRSGARIAPGLRSGRLAAAGLSSPSAAPSFAAASAVDRSRRCDDHFVPRDSHPSADASIVLATFESRHAAEQWLASVGRDFRKQARKGHAEVFVASANTDGSLKLTESRVLTATGIAALIPHLVASLMLGFLGIGSMLKGARIEGRAIHKRASQVGSDEQRAHAMLAQAGANAAIVLVGCDDSRLRQMLTAQAADHAVETWDGLRSEFLAELDPGVGHDWVRAALGEPLSTDD